MDQVKAPRPTLAKVAELAGVSVSTASLAFSGAGPVSPETKQKVMDAAAALNYVGPNPLGRQLRSGRSGIIGVIIGDQLKRAFRDPVSIQVLDGMVSTLGAEGLGVLLIPGIPDPSSPTGHAEHPSGSPAVDPLIESAAMDVAVMLCGGTHDGGFNALERRGVPVVVVEGSHIPGMPLVSIRDREGMAAVMSHLVGLGHRRVAEIALPLAWDSTVGWADDARLAQVERTPTVNRLAGVRDILKPVITWETEASLVEYGRAGAQAILARDWAPGERPTAVLAHSDLLAAGAVLGAREAGLRVPDDVSVAGFDGLDLPWMAPDVLTSVHQPLAEKGAEIGQAVIALLAGEPAQTVTLDVDLVIGTTTGPPPKNT